jgi:hypothetical protein
MNIKHSTLAGLVVTAGFLLTAWPDPAAAQQPTPDQVAAIRKSCRSDFMSHCSGVQPGGKDALACLSRNIGNVSAPCRTALNAITAKPAAPAAAAEPAPPPAAAPGAARSASPPATEHLTTAPPAAEPVPHPAIAKPVKKPPKPKRVTTAPPAPAEAAAVTAKPSPEQLNAVRAACRSDFMAHCSSVQPGGAEALQCLQRNAAQLSTPCRSAVASIAAGAPATAPPASVTAAPTVAPLAPMPMLLPRVALQILRICSAEQRRLCAGVPVGGGRIINCLAENAQRLSPECYGAMERASR